MKQVDLYIDYKSPFAYLVVSDAYDLERDFEVEVNWLPYSLNIPSFMGSVEERTPHQWRRVRYSYADARRLANRKGLTVRGPEKVYDTRLCHIGMLYAKEQGVFRAYNDYVFPRFWRREFAIESREEIERALAAAGADAAGFATYAAGRGGELHDRITVEAEERGVFGVPMFVVGSELYWGTDRLYLVREQLETQGLRRRQAA